MHQLPFISLFLAALGPSADPGSSNSVAVLTTDPLGVASDVVVFDGRSSADDVGRVVATIPHREGAMLRGAASSQGTLAIVAGTRPSRDLSFDSTLWWLEPGQPPLAVCEDVVHASRPHFDSSDQLLVTRGFAGTDPEPVNGRIESLRVDRLTLELFDPSTGGLRLLHAFDGYMLFVAGSSDEETFVYRVWPGGADVIALDLDSQDVRLISPVLPFARDFSVDEDGNLIFVQRDDEDVRGWSVEQLDTETGDRHILYSSRDMRMLPFVLGKHVGLQIPAVGLSWIDGGQVFDAASSAEPGVLAHVRIVDADARRGIGVLAGKGMPRVFVGDFEGGGWGTLPTDGRPEPVGFVPGGVW